MIVFACSAWEEQVRNKPFVWERTATPAEDEWKAELATDIFLGVIALSAAGVFLVYAYFVSYGVVAQAASQHWLSH